MRLVDEKGGDARHILPEIQKAQAEFDQARLEAMRKVNPKAKEMHRELGKMQSKIEKKRQSLHSSMQQADEESVRSERRERASFAPPPQQ